MRISEAWTDRIIGSCLCVVTLAAVIMTDRAGMPQKWHAAILGALVPFAAVVSIKRNSWPRSIFWTTLGACFAVNLLLVGIFFEFILAKVATFGWLWWMPVAFIQAIAILHFQPLIEKKFRSK